MRILIVEDEHKIATALKTGLEQERYAVDLAFDGEAGFDLAATEPYDLIILDLMLPKMDGLTICKKLREEEGVHTPILMLTAKSQLEDRVNGLNTGADDYLTKPFAFTELLARTRALTRRSQPTKKTYLEYDNLTLNPQSFEVKRDGKKINLSKKEFTLLEYLLRHPNQTLTKQQLIEHVWDYEANVLPNTVEVYIGYLRKKIDKPFAGAKKLIKTIHGFGYKLGHD